LRILVDECLPEDLVAWLKDSDVKTVQQVGWAGVKKIISEIQAALVRFVPGVPGQYAEIPQPPH
jgi:predicted nuclease of predicted toxin-antitoxin system